MEFIFYNDLYNDLGIYPSKELRKRRIFTLSYPLFTRITLLINEDAAIN